MVNVSDKRYTSVYQGNIQLQNLNKKSVSFLDQNSNSDGPGFFPNGPWNQPTAQGLGPVDYTNTALEPHSTGVDPTMGIGNMPVPIEWILNQMNFNGGLVGQDRVEPITVQGAERGISKLANHYVDCIQDFEKLTEEEKERIMASAFEALASLKPQQAAVELPFQARKPADFFAVGEKLHNIGCSFGHGIVTSLDNSEEYAGVVSEMLGGHQVQGCHWQFVSGSLKHFETLLGLTNPNIKGVMKLFNDHFEKCGEDVPYIHICHSEGANTCDQALKRMPEERRKNIHIISVGPAKYIDPELCGSVFNIVNDNDGIAKKVDKKGHKKAVRDGNIEIVPEDPSVGTFEAHSFKNPRTQAALQERLENLFNTLTSN